MGAYRRQNWETLDLVDDRKVERLAGATARAGVYVTPTLAFFRLWFATELTDEDGPGRARTTPTSRRRCATGTSGRRAQYWKNPPSEAHRARYIAIRNRMVKAIVDSGGHIMAGSDGPGGLMGYGWSLHRELAMLVDAGLSPMQALAAATRDPAAWLGAERDWGTLQRGRRADLVLLDADPVADIRNTSRIAAVSIGGRWLERRDLDDMVEAARVRLHP